MEWSRIAQVDPPVGRPVLVRTAENDAPVIAFLSPNKIWYAGGALLQNSMTLLGATPTEWCEPEGPETL